MLNIVGRTGHFLQPQRTVSFLLKIPILYHSRPLIFFLFSCSVVSDFAASWTAAHQASLSFTISQVSDAIAPSHPLSPSFTPALNLSQHQIAFASELVLHIRWPKYWSLSFSIIPSNEYSGLISFRIDLLAVQGTLKCLLQHHGSKTSVLRRSAFFMVELSLLYMTTGKTIALTLWTFVEKVMFLLLILPRFVTAFLPRSKCLQLVLDLRSQMPLMERGVLHGFMTHKTVSLAGIGENLETTINTWEKQMGAWNPLF